MEKRGDEVHATETEASGGSKEGVVRWVLIIGTVLAIIGLTLVWTTGAAVQDEGADSETSVGNRISAEQDAADERGEPIAPAMDASSGETSPATGDTAEAESPPED